MTLFYQNSIKTVHLEPTTKCNASCPMCARNINGGADNPNLPLVDLSLEDAKQIFSKLFIQNLYKMYMCGNYGDPIVSNYTLDIFKYFQTCNSKITLAMHTNGSARNAEWWENLGKVFKNNDKNYVVFGIDGVDTNHLYRRGTDISKILENALAFIKSGGRARWHFIVFKHNEHEIDKARDLAKNLGFVDFKLKKTGRFFSNARMATKQYHEVQNRRGEVEYRLEPPSDPNLMNAALKNEATIVEKYGSMEKYMRETKINCKVLQDESVYVSAEGFVFPCCWLANQMYVWYQKPKTNQVWQLIEKCGGISILDGRKGIEKIVENDFFQQIKQLWNTEKKLWVCGKQCGSDFDPFANQFLHHNTSKPRNH